MNIYAILKNGTYIEICDPVSPYPEFLSIVAFQEGGVRTLTTYAQWEADNGSLLAQVPTADLLAVTKEPPQSTDLQFYQEAQYDPTYGQKP